MLLLFHFFFLLFIYSHVHMCIHCLGHFSPLPPVLFHFLKRKWRHKEIKLFAHSYRAVKHRAEVQRPLLLQNLGSNPYHTALDWTQVGSDSCLTITKPQGWLHTGSMSRFIFKPALLISLLEPERNSGPPGYWTHGGLSFSSTPDRICKWEIPGMSGFCK
jgi:hypothetical protein